MDTQDSSFHLIASHKQLWVLLLANLLVSVGAYMMIPDMLEYTQRLGFSNVEKAVMTGAYLLGIFVFGPFVNYLVERYRRKNICLLALLLLAVSIIEISYIRATPMAANILLIVLLRFVSGAFFGLAQMVLLSTLVIDSVPSAFRTEANCLANWFGCISMAVGPMAALCAILHKGASWPLTLSVALVLLAFILICTVKFPFKTPPDEIRMFSLDRFFLSKGGWLIVVLIFVAMVPGVFYALNLPIAFYAWLAFGLVLAALADYFLLAGIRMKNKIVLSLLLMTITLGAMSAFSSAISDLPFVTLPIGFGFGLFAECMLLLFIKLSCHCQRGTSQSTYFLARESGVNIGLSAGLLFFNESVHHATLCLLIIIVCTGCLYIGYIYNWHVRHENR